MERRGGMRAGEREELWGALQEEKRSVGRNWLNYHSGTRTYPEVTEEKWN